MFSVKGAMVGGVFCMMFQRKWPMMGLFAGVGIGSATNLLALEFNKIERREKMISQVVCEKKNNKMQMGEKIDVLKL